MSWAGTVMSKAGAVKVVGISKVKVGPTHRQTDQQTDSWGGLETLLLIPCRAGLQNVRNPASAACRQGQNFVGRKGLGEKRKRKKKKKDKGKKKKKEKRKKGEKD